jgi:hypothetical protein
MRDEIYDQVAKELKTGLVMEGLWLKSMMETGGDSSKAKLRYVDNRVSYIIARRRISFIKRFFIAIGLIPPFYVLGVILFGLIYFLGFRRTTTNEQEVFIGIIAGLISLILYLTTSIKVCRRDFNKEPELVLIDDLGSTK